MLRLISKIAVGTYTFDSVMSIEIQSSWENLTTTAVLSIPNTLFNKNVSYKKAFKPGTEIEIFLGYHPVLKSRFKGYIRKVTPKEVIEVHCEDSMYLLKKEVVKSYSEVSVSLKKLLSDLSIPTTPNVEVANLGTVRYQNVNKASILESLSKYGIYTFYRNGILNTGLPYTGGGNDLQFNFYGEKCNIISSNLEFVETESNGIYLRGVNFKSTGKTEELYCYYVGDKIVVNQVKPSDKDERTLNFYQLSTSEVSDILKDKLPTYSYVGYSGSFETFLEPLVQHGDTVHLSDKRYKDRSGVYKVKGVNTTFSPAGGRQSITLDLGI